MILYPTIKCKADITLILPPREKELTDDEKESIAFQIQVFLNSSCELIEISKGQKINFKIDIKEI